LAGSHSAGQYPRNHLGTGEVLDPFMGAGATVAAEALEIQFAMILAYLAGGTLAVMVQRLVAERLENVQSLVSFVQGCL
jgi:hypothetical protein